MSHSQCELLSPRQCCVQDQFFAGEMWVKTAYEFTLRRMADQELGGELLHHGPRASMPLFQPGDTLCTREEAANAFRGVEILQPVGKEINPAVYFRRAGEQENNSTRRKTRLRRRLAVDMSEWFGRIVLPRTDRRRNNYLRVQGSYHQPRHKPRHEKISKSGTGFYRV